MNSKNHINAEQAFRILSKDDLIKILLERLSKESGDTIPITIFDTALSPLEAVTRFLREKNKRIGQIARILNKRPSSISEAYRNSRTKLFEIRETDTFIPLEVFKQYPDLSVLETVVIFMREREMRFADIAIILNRDPRTIWTINKRAKEKLETNDEKKIQAPRRRPLKKRRTKNAKE